MASNSFRFLALLLLFCRVFFRPAASDGVTGDETMLMRYKEWMVKYDRAYLNDEEQQHRFEIFKSNVEYIEASNNMSARRYSLGVNQFADLTKEEFKSTHLRLVIPNTTLSSLPFRYSSFSAPPSVDWRAKGAVTPVKDQGNCGSSWAFSATAAIEGVFQITNGTLLSISEQELIDCAKDTNGCGGGHFVYAFEFVINNGGITTEENYPYMKHKGVCNKTMTMDHAETIKSYEKVPPKDEASLMQAVANQPVSVAIDAAAVQFYMGGIYDGPCGTDLNHAVTIVGYGKNSTTGLSYWIVKTSWGAGWGEGGYVMMHKDVEDRSGICGITLQPYYPNMYDRRSPPPPSPSPPPPPPPPPPKIDSSGRLPVVGVIVFAVVFCLSVTLVLVLCTVRARARPQPAQLRALVFF